MKTELIDGNNSIRIDNFAFSACSSLEKIELPAKLKKVNGSAFYGATALRSIIVQKGNKSF